jgi:hypothetical protein
LPEYISKAAHHYLMADEGATVKAFCEKQQQLKVGDVDRVN